MAVFEYRGFDRAGKAVSGIIDADNPKVARSRLRKQGLFPTEVNEQAKGGGATRGSGLNVEIDFSKYFQFVTVRDISILTRQMATLLGAAVPMAETLTALVEQTEKPKLKVVLSEVKEDVSEGSPLADALGKHPSMFNDLFVHMVRAGERSGALSQVLVRLADFGEAQVKLRGKVLGAMIYPALMGVVGILILLGLFLFAVPQMRELIDSIMGDNVPLITKVVFLLGDILTNPFAWCCGLPMAIGSGIGLWYWVNHLGGRRSWDNFKLRIPLFGRVNRMVAVARFCRTLSTLLISGVPILSAMGIVKDVIGNAVLREAVESAAANIQEGQSIAGPLRKSGEFPPLVTHMIAIGEKTGELENMLLNVADAYESQVETTVEGLTQLLGPLMIIVMGGVVFLVALGLLWPLSQLAGAMQNL